MSHFYDCSQEPFLTDAKTPSQAKKIGAYPSVTTILSSKKSDFLDNIWTPRKLVELARLHPEASSTELMDMKYGFRTSPIDGKPISSSEFGTAIHARLEHQIESIMRTGNIDQESVTAWDSWAFPFINFMSDRDIEPVATEKILFCHKFKSVGSVDFIGKIDGKYHLFDYKCRDTKGTGGKFYEEKDCTQLAIEARFLKDTLGLDYDPGITSVCICVESKKHYHKNWTKAQAKKGVTRFRYLAKLYWMDWMPKGR